MNRLKEYLNMPLKAMDLLHPLTAFGYDLHTRVAHHLITTGKAQHMGMVFKNHKTHGLMQRPGSTKMETYFIGNGDLRESLDK